MTSVGKSKPYAVDVHPQAEQIRRELAENVQIASISKKYGIHRNALTFYRKNRMPEQVVKAVEKRDLTNAEELFQIILKTVRYMETLSASCDAELRDPDNPELYYMGTRAEDVDVIWEEPIETASGVIFKKHRDKLQDMIDKNMSGGNLISTRISKTDNSVLLIKSSDTLTKQMDMLVQAWRTIDQGKSSFLGTPAWNRVVKVVLDATEEHPEIRRRIADDLSRITS